MDARQSKAVGIHYNIHMYSIIIICHTQDTLGIKRLNYLSKILTGEAKRINL